MKITLNQQEKHYLREVAENYRKQTGENYSIFHILSILTSKYEENLEKDMKEVMDIKLREYQEGLNK